jgi:CRISPR-associated endonuclease/helicase Cas3
MEWISHDDRTLKEHLQGLKAVVDYLLMEKTQNIWQPEDLKRLIHNLISYHDLAKASIFFQIYLSNALIQKDGHRDYSNVELKDFIKSNKDKFNEWFYSPQLKDHALFGGWAFLENFESTERYNLNGFLALKILKRHHGYLRDFSLKTMNPNPDKNHLIKISENIAFDKYARLCDELKLPFAIPDMKRILDGFKSLHFYKIEKFLQQNQDSSYFFKTLFLYSLLLSADKGDVMLKEKKFNRCRLNSKIIDDYKTKKLKTDYSINKLREEAYQLAVNRINELGDNNFFSITLPTGLGKTFTAYKAALVLKEKYVPDFRIVYCLPFTSIIDQNAYIFKDIFLKMKLDTDLIGVHHYLSTPDFQNEEEGRYTEWDYHTEGWQNEVTITTFVQLWESIFANHNKQLRKYHNLVNSIIILDEVQSIKPSLIPALEFVMENMAKYFNTKFILVTATQPFVLREKVIELCAITDRDYFFKKLNRTLIAKTFLKKGVLGEEMLSEIIIKKYKETQRSILIICNTIRYSQNLYNILMEQIESENLFYLSASVIPYTREQVLNKQINPRLKLNKPVILISTQVIEAGVDVDFDLVFRDFAPLSSINQAAGRCNRNFTKGVSTVFLFRSGKENIYDPTQLAVTESTLNKFEDVIYENEFYKMNELFFSEIKKRIQDNSDASERLINSILALQFQDVGSNPNYRLIVNQYPENNFYIPINEEAELLWEEYLDKLKIEEYFNRKKELKMHTPKMMKFVAKIPDYIHQPKPEEKDNVIKYDIDWNAFYDKNLGYKLHKQEKSIEIF